MSEGVFCWLRSTHTHPAESREMEKIQDGGSTVIPIATTATTTVVELGAAPQVFAAAQAAQGQMHSLSRRASPSG